MHTQLGVNQASIFVWGDQPLALPCHSSNYGVLLHASSIHRWMITNAQRQNSELDMASGTFERACLPSEKHSYSPTHLGTAAPPSTQPCRRWGHSALGSASLLFSVLHSQTAHLHGMQSGPGDMLFMYLQTATCHRHSQTLVHSRCKAKAASGPKYMLVNT